MHAEVPERQPFERLERLENKKMLEDLRMTPNDLFHPSPKPPIVFHLPSTDSLDNI